MRHLGREKKSTDIYFKIYNLYFLNQFNLYILYLRLALWPVCPPALTRTRSLPRASPAITAATIAAQRLHGAAHTYLQNNNKNLHNNIHRHRRSGWLRNAEVFGLQPLQVKFYCLYHQLQCIFSSWTCSYDTRQIWTISCIIRFSLFKDNQILSHFFQSP